MPNFYFVNGGQSIQAAIIAASAGDTIMVGTGVYIEDLIIDKALNLISLDGAGTTFVNGTVSITAGNVNFGDTNHGFTITAGDTDTAAVLLGAVANVHIEGNTLVGNATAAASLDTYGLLATGGSNNINIENNVFSGTADELLRINGEANGAADSHGILLTDNQFTGTVTSGNARVVLDADGSTISGNTFSGGGDAALVLLQDGNTVAPTNTFTGFGTGTDIATVGSFDLGTVSTAENLTLLDHASNIQTFDDMGTGPITDGENGWHVDAGGRDQQIVHVGGGDNEFRMSSDPNIPDFAGPYSPALPIAAGEAAVGARAAGHSISFDFSAVNASPDGSRLEIDFGNHAGTDRNNVMVIESSPATNGIRIAVNEPLPDGSFTNNNFAAFTGNVTLATGVNPAVSHHIELRLTYVDGPDNDIIQVYLDGQFIGTTTTFENYHDAINGLHDANALANLTDRVFFRPNGSGAPQDGLGPLNAGFLIDNVSSAVYNNTSGTGNALDNIITGNTGDNALSGLGGADTLSGNGGNDSLTGGAGDDTLDGGAGIDVANYTGTRGDYTITYDGTTATVVDDRGGSPDGTDTVAHAGRLNFTDRDVLLVGAGSDFTTIQSAIDAASDGDIIIVAAGVYTENVNFNKSVTVLGAHAGDAGTDGGRNAASGTGESTIVGRSDITASGAVTIDGFRFLNDATTTGGGPGDPTLQIQNGNDHVVTNSIFYSTVAGGARPSPDDRAISMPVIADGDITISNNYFTGSQTGLFGTASWGREVWFDGGGVDLTITGNTFEFGRTALNLDILGTSEVLVQDNTFRSDGTGLAVGFSTENLTAIDNDFQDVGEEFNLRNLTVDTVFDAEVAVDTVTPGPLVDGPDLDLDLDDANPNDLIVVLGGNGNDTLSGTSGADVLDGNNHPSPIADNDTLNGRGGDDFLFGRAGDDTLDGGAGNDLLDGGAGIDTATGYSNAATLSVIGGNWSVTDGADVDTLVGVEKVVINGVNYWLVGAGGPGTIQEAIDAAAPGDTILIAAGTYHENVTVNKAGLKLIGAGDSTVIEGTFRTDNSITGSTADFFKTATSYFDTAGNGVTITADNVTLQDLKVSSFLTAIEFGEGVDHTLIKNVTLSDSVNGLRKGTAVDLTDLNIDHGTITEVYLGINFAKSVTAGDGLLTGLTIDGTVFEHITQKGIYTETLSNGLIKNIVMNDVGQYGGGPAFGAAGMHGNGIDLNLKYEVGVYTNITIEGFQFTNVGLSNGLGTPHANAGAIAVKARDDATSYNTNPADFTGAVIIQNGTINGTSTGIRAGEAGKNIADPAVTITNVGITNAVHSATHGDVANVTQSIETVTLTDAADTLVASPTSTGPIVIHAKDGNDNVTAGNGNDTLDGGAGDDTLHGAGGTDTATYSGPITVANVTTVDDIDPITDGLQAGWQVDATANGEGTDILDDVEVIDGAGSDILLVGNGGYATIQEAINVAAAGDTILIADGIYNGNVTLKSGITIIGESEAGVIVNGTMFTPATLTDTTVSKMSVYNVGDTMLLDMRGTTDITDVVFDQVTFSLSGDFTGEMPIGNGQIHGTIALHDGPDGDSAGLTFQHVTMASNDHNFLGSTAFVYTLMESIGGAKLLLDDLTMSGTASGTDSGLGAQWNMSPQNSNTQHAAVEIKNSHTSGGANFYVSGFDSVDIHNNVFDGQAIALNGVKNATVTDNVFQNIDNTFTSNGSHHRGLMIEDAYGTTGVSHVTVTGNTFHNIDALDGAISFQRFTGGVPADTATIGRLNDVTISGNTFTDLGPGVNPTFLNATFFGVDAVLPADFNDAQLIIGTAAPDVITDTSTGEMAVFSGPGDDTIHGGVGNDALSGGAESDTATYDATLSAASFTYDSVNHGWVVDAGAEGIDFLTGIEIVTDGAGNTFRLVDISGAGGYAHIQDAIDAADPGDTILIAPGTYSETEQYVPGDFHGLYINKPNLTLLGYSSADGELITNAADAKAFGPTVIAAAQNMFGANHWIDVGGDGTVIRGLHLQAGTETTNKLLEIWADDVTVQHNFIDVYEGGTNYTYAIAVYINDNGTTTSEVSSYTIDGNILNEGVLAANGVGNPPGIGATQQITNNHFEGVFDSNGDGRYDTIVVNGTVPGTGWLLAPSEFPTVTGNTFANNTTPFLLRGSDADAANFPTAAQIAELLGANGDNDLSYAYVLDSGGNLRTALRNDGGGDYHSFAVTNTLDTLNLALDNTSDDVFGGQRTYMQVGDTVIIQSGDGAPVNSAVMVENLTIRATEHSADLNLTLATQLADGTSIPGGVVQVTLADYAAGLGADVDVTGNGLDNTITGNSGDNTLSGLGGTDTLRGNGGNDHLIGGSGTDTAVFSGSRSDYRIDEVSPGVYEVEDLRAGSPDDIDTLEGIENIQFFDGTFNPAAILNDPLLGTVSITGDPTEDETLTADTSGLSDADGFGTLHYQWQRDSGSGFVDVGTDQPTYDLGDADVGADFRVVVTYEDGNGTDESVTSGEVGPVANLNDAPTGGVTITGSVTEDATLTADTSTLADADTLGTLHYQWQRDTGSGFVNVGTDQPTYDLGDADVTANFRVIVSYQDGYGTDESVTSGTVGPIDNINDAPAGGVTIDGTVAEDQTLTANTTALTDADGLGTLHYQWQRDDGGGFVNVGTDQPTYLLSDADVAADIRVIVSYEDSFGTDESVTSGEVGPVDNGNDPPVAQDGPVTGNRNTPIPGVVTATDIDNTPAQLTYSLVGANGGALHGTVVLQPDGNFIYTPASNYSGADSFQFRANDGLADSNVGTISIVVNPAGPIDAPVAGDDAGSVSEYQTVLGNVITDVGPGQDTDPGNAPLTISAISGGTVGVALAGTLGSLTLNANGSYSYVANNAESLYAGISGTDTFTYTVSNGLGTDTATLTITVNGVNTGTNGNDHVIGGPGDETLSAGAGDDELKGNGGNDSIVGGDGNDTIFGGAGNDSIGGNAGDDIIVGEDGDDVIGGDDGNDQVNGGAGNDTIFGGAGNDILGGGTGDDIIVGMDDNDTIFGEDGNDQANGGAGDDIMVGGAGNDIFGGGSGNDIIVGDDGDDQLWGEDGNDSLNGGAGNDTVAGGTGDDVLGGGADDDIVVGHEGNDVLFGEAGNDRLNGGDGADIVIGGDGDDEVGGGAGNDDLNGGFGNDTLFGEDGDDILNGGAGNDLLLGMAGNDTFAFFAGDGSDTILDFAAGGVEDRIWFIGTDLHSLADVQSHASFNPGTGATTINYAGGSLTLNGVALNQLTASDFIFS